MPKFWRIMCTWKDTHSDEEDDSKHAEFEVLIETLTNFHYGVISSEVGSTGYRHHHAFLKFNSPVDPIELAKEEDVFGGTHPHLQGITREPHRAWCYVIKDRRYTMIGNITTARYNMQCALKWKQQHFHRCTKSMSGLPFVVCRLPLDELKRRHVDHLNKQEIGEATRYSMLIWEIENNKQIFN